MSVRAIALTVRASTGPIDTPWGAQLYNIEKRVRDGDKAGVHARWESGRHILKQRIGKQLPKGLRQQVCKALKLSQAEVNYRIQFAERCSTDSEVFKVLNTFGNWTQIITKFLPKPKRRMRTAVQIRMADIKRLAKHCHALTPKSLTTDQRSALEALREELDRLLQPSTRKEVS
jgi:hypothetical protein